MTSFGSFRLAPKKDTGPIREVHSSLIVANLVATRSKSNGQNFAVLDLGAARGGNVDFYSTISSKIHIEDLFRSITEQRNSGFSELSFEAILTCESSTRFDIIFLWDILNYLSPSEITALGEHLEQFCHSKTIVYALISGAPSMPRVPGRYQIGQDSKLIAEYGREDEIKSPRYSKTHFKKLLPSFERTRSYLLRNGMEEYLFFYRGEEDVKGVETIASATLESLPEVPTSLARVN